MLLFLHGSSPNGLQKQNLSLQYEKLIQKIQEYKKSIQTLKAVVKLHRKESLNYKNSVLSKENHSKVLKHKIKNMEEDNWEWKKACQRQSKDIKGLVSLMLAMVIIVLIILIIINNKPNKNSEKKTNT